MPDLQAETVLAVVAGEARLVEKLFGKLGVVVVLQVKFVLPAGIPTFQRLMEDGVVHGFAAAFEQFVDNLLPVNGPVHGLAHQRPGFARCVPRFGVWVPVHLADIVLAKGKDGQADSGQRAFQYFHARVNGLLMQHLGHVHHVGFAR